MFDENSKIIKEAKGKTMKQSEFQELVINEFKEQKKFNELFSKRLDSIEYRLTRLESFHEKDIKNYKSR